MPRISAPKSCRLPFDDGAAQQQAAVHHDAVALNAGNRGSLKAHNLGLGVGEAEFPSYGAVLDPQRANFRCAVQIDRAGHERALDMDTAVVNGGAVLAAERQEAQEVRPDLVLLRGRAWSGPGEGAWFAFEGSVQQFALRRFERFELLQSGHTEPHYPGNAQPSRKLCSEFE